MLPHLLMVTYPMNKYISKICLCIPKSSVSERIGHTAKDLIHVRQLLEDIEYALFVPRIVLFYHDYIPMHSNDIPCPFLLFSGSQIVFET
jgi:hypothetical protein